MKILFRVDGGLNSGLGHLIRCMAIARRLKDHFKGIKICFLTEENKFSNDLLSKNGFSFEIREKLSEETFISNSIKKANAAVLFIDKIYPYSAEFIKEIRKQIRVSMFHIWCDGTFESDLFIIPASHNSNSVLKDERWLTSPVKLYEGFPYVILNDKILESKQKSGINTNPLHIVITTGGSDPKGVLIRLLEYLLDFNMKNIKITVLVGETFSYPDKLRNLQKRLSDIFTFLPFNYTDFAAADLAVNTFGSSTYELIYLGIPVLSIGHADRNAQASACLAKKYGIIKDLGHIDDLTGIKFLSSLTELISNPKQLLEMQKKSRHLIDGRGCERVAELIYSLRAV